MTLVPGHISGCQCGLCERAARRRAFEEAASLIERCDLHQLFGDHDDDEEQLLSAAQSHVVETLRRKAQRA